MFLYPNLRRVVTYVAETKPCLEPGCKPYPKKPGNPVRCWWHWLAKQSPVVQAEAAAARLAAYRAGGQPDRPRVVPQLWPEGERWCAGCQSMVPLFYARGSRCRSCASEAAHDARVQETYGLAPGQYDELFAAQGGRCAICRNKPAEMRLAVDHDHATGAVRGLLCTQCNHDLLGGAQDRLDVLKAAVAYMEAPPASDAWLWGIKRREYGLEAQEPTNPFRDPDTYATARIRRRRA